MLAKQKSAVATLRGDGLASEPETTQSIDLRLGTVIDGRYRIERLIGHGGMGLVYQATHIRLRKTFAIKVLRRASEPSDVIRFQREAESASAIGNAHIVSVSDFGTLPDGSTYFAMEYLEGIDLLGAMKAAGTMPVDRACHIAIQLCRALGAAHEAGIVHRDLKPENVFLVDLNGDSDFVKVLDFGIAKVTHAPSSLTQDDILGTPHYMSPEQCDGLRIDHRTDVYAMGVLLYEMVSGRVPHDDKTATAIFHKHLYERPTPIDFYVPEASLRLRRIIERCLEKDANRRYQSMGDLQADLEKLRETGEGSRERLAAGWRAGVRARSKRSAVGIALLMAALVGIFLWALPSDEPTEPNASREARRPPEVVAPVKENVVPQEVQSRDRQLDPAVSRAGGKDGNDADPRTARPRPRTLRKPNRKIAPRRTAKPTQRREAGGSDEVLDPWM